MEKKFQNYFLVTKITTNDIGKCSWNGNLFEEMGTERSTGKNDGFWLLSGIFKDYTKQNIMAVLRKANPHSVVICRFIKKS